MMISKLAKWIGKILRFKHPMPSMLDVDEARGVLQMLEMTRKVEYSCDDAYKLLDKFAEMVYRGEDASSLMPLVQHHLELCGNCREEFEALLRILKATK